MRKNHIIRTFLVAVAVSGAILTFASLRGPVGPAADSSCKESMESCPEDRQGGKMIWENLSHQFFSYTNVP